MSKLQEHYKEGTELIIEMMKNNGKDWAKGWTSSIGVPVNAKTLKPYQGFNVIWLMKERKTSAKWGTFLAWKDLGRQVAKGEKGTLVTYFKPLSEDEKIIKKTEWGFVLKYSKVFNESQLVGYEVPLKEETKSFDNKIVEDFIINTQAKVSHGSASAFYRPSTDEISMPNKSDFIDSKNSTAEINYYSTLCHELTHWTGAQKRLDRNFTKKETRKEYAFEELVAELGSVFLGMALGFEPVPRDDHAKYLNNWLEILQSDNKFIFQASSKATQAVNFLYNLQENAQKKTA